MDEVLVGGAGSDALARPDEFASLVQGPGPFVSLFIETAFVADDMARLDNTPPPR